MPVNFPQLQKFIRQAGSRAREQDKERSQKLELSRQLLGQFNTEQSYLQGLVEDAAGTNKNLRCAIPGDEPLTTAIDPPPTAGNVTLLAADGSQVNPSRHDAVLFGVVNVGVFRMRLGEAEPPREFTETQLLTGDELYKEGSDPVSLDYSDLTEEIIALRRDLNERHLLAELAQSEDPPVLALTDGPLELYRERQSSAEYQKLFDQYLKVLHALKDLNAVVAGYVDRPRSDLIVRLLELADLGRDRINEGGKTRPLGGVVDIQLFQEILKPGMRSGLFRIQSPSSFTDELGLHFFYLNTGRDKHPALARVEIPAWVAGVHGMVDMLHAALLEQCRLMGSRPYPYALHRAHEIALVTYAEKGQIEEMIIGEYLRQGIPVAGRSNKQSAKDLPGRTPHLP